MAGALLAAQARKEHSLVIAPGQSTYGAELSVQLAIVPCPCTGAFRFDSPLPKSNELLKPRS